MSVLLPFHDTYLKVQNFHDDFLLIRADAPGYTQAFGRALFQAHLPFIEEVIITEVEICLKLNARFTPFDLRRLIDLPVENVSEPQQYRLPIWFDPKGDWDTLKDHTGLTQSDAIAVLTNGTFSIAMFGFLPGFIYCSGLPELLHLPRKEKPSKYIKAQSLAIGEQYLGLYALDSPGGWQVIGHCPISLLQIPKLPPVTVNLGDRFKLEAIDHAQFKALQNDPVSLTTYNA